MSLHTLSIHELKEGLVTKKWTSVEICQSLLDQNDKHNKELNALCSFNENILEEAKRCDDQGYSKDSPTLFGIPIGIKDMICVKGMKTTAASKMLENFVAPYSATLVNKLRQSGALIFSKCNQDEFAMGSSNEYSLFGPCLNPWDRKRVPGGSSGGGASSVAAYLVPATIGTDTGGSIRQPASFCGVVGLKPTYGRVSRYGVIAFASSLDQAGPMTRSVQDASLVLESLCGQDPHDQTTSTRAVPEFTKNLKSDLSGLRIGVVKEHFSDTVDSEVRQRVEEALKLAEAQGAKLIDIHLEHSAAGVAAYYLVSASETSSNLSRYDGVRFGYRSDFNKKPAESLAEFYSRSRGEGFGTEVKRRIALGTYALSSGYYDAYYKKAAQVRRLIQDDFIDAFQKCDVIAGPVCSTPAFKIGERVSDPLQMYTNDAFTVLANLAGIPAMSVPVGFTSEGLPVGLQLCASHFEEQVMLNTAYAVETKLNLVRGPEDVL